MGNSYQEEVNQFVDDIMKVANDTASTEGLKKEAGIKDVFTRKKKADQALDVAGNKAKANSMFAGIGGDDSASEQQESTPSKWKRIKAKFFKKSNEDTELMIEKIAAAGDVDVDILLDYIEKTAEENDIDGQDVVDALYEDVEDNYDEDSEEYEDSEEHEDEENYEEDLNEDMINEAVEKVAFVSNLNDEDVVNYISKVAYENDVDELEVLAAMEDEADELLEKEAAPEFLNGVGKKVKNTIIDQKAYGKYKNLNDYKKILAEDKIKLTPNEAKDLMAARLNVAKRPAMIAGGIAGLGAAAYGGKKLYDRIQARKAAEAEKEAFEVLIEEALEKVAYVADVETESVIDYIEKVAFENDVDELEVLAAMEEEAVAKEKIKLLEKLRGGAGKVGGFAAKHKVPLAVAGLGAATALGGGAYLYNKKRKARQEEAEKEAFEYAIDEALEKIAFVSDLDTDSVVDYIEKVAYENNVDELEVLAAMDKEAEEAISAEEKKKLIDRIKGVPGFVGAKAGQAGKFVGKNKLPVGLGLGAATALGGGAYLYNKKRKARQEEAEKEAEIEA